MIYTTSGDVTITADGPLRSHTEYSPSGSASRYTQYNRNNLNRLTLLDTPEGDTAMSYDGLGLLRTYDDGGGVITYDYNAAAQLVSLAEPGGSCSGQTFTSPGAASTKCTLFSVNDDGQRTAIRYPGGQTLTYTLDDTGRPSKIVGKTSSNNGSSTTTRLDLALTYTDGSAPATGTNPNKDTRLVTSVTDAITARKTAYSYDSLDRLTVANTAPTAGGSTTDYEAFCYDGAGNRTKYYTAAGATCSTSNPAVTYTYDGANAMTDAVAGSGAPALSGSGFSYDANGNQTSAKSFPGRTVAYGDRDAAVSTTPAGGPAVASTYARGGNSERLTTGSMSFLPSLLGPAPARSSTGTTTTWTIRDPDGELLALRVGTTTDSAGATSYYAFTDQVDAVRHLVTASGVAANSYSYSAYGVTKSVNESVSNPYRYGAGYTDASTGLIKLGLRYYDPASGRFTQVDPTGQEANDYLYVGASPVTLSDPNGDIAPVIVIGALAIARGAAMIAPRAGAATGQAARAAAPLRVSARNPSAAVQAQRRWTQRLEQRGYECQTRGGCGLGDKAHVDYRRPGSQEWRTVHIG